MRNEKPSAAKWTIAHLLALTTLVAVICAGSLWLGNDYGFLATIPAFLSAVVLASTRGRTVMGACIGAVVLAFLAATLIVQFDRTDPRFLKATVLLGLFGSVFGASIHCLKLNRYLLGSSGLIVGLLSLFVISMMVVPGQPTMRPNSTVPATQNKGLQTKPSISRFDLR